MYFHVWFDSVVTTNENSVSKYQQVAYISDVEQQELDAWIKQLPEDLQKK